MNYPTTEKELLAIVETLKEFRHILLGYVINVWTDHQVLCSFKAVHDSQRVMRQRLLLEEYGATIKHIEGKKNVVADALSRIDFEESNNMFECFVNDEIEQFNDFDRLQLKNIEKVQAENRDEMRIYGFREEPCGTKLRVHHNRIVIPLPLVNNLIDWYHSNLGHPGMNRMKATVKSFYYWKGMDREIEKHVKNCKECQKFKKTAVRPVGHVPLRTGRSVTPWEKVHTDVIGPWGIDVKILDTGKIIKRTISALTIICEATLWPEIKFLVKNNPKSVHIAYAFDQEWLCRYPRPAVVVYDNGGEFCGSEFQELLRSYGIKGVPTTVRNPQSNGCVERIHLTAADIMRTLDLEVETECPILVNDAINTMLQATAWGLRTTVSTVTETSPAGAVFNRDMIFNFKMRANWENIARKRDKLAEIGNRRENSKRKEHVYRVGDKVLIVRKKYERKRKIGDAPTEGPFEITRVNDMNGTVRIQRNRYTETINIRRLKPFHDIDNNEAQ